MRIRGHVTMITIETQDKESVISSLTIKTIDTYYYFMSLVSQCLWL